MKFKSNFIKLTTATALTLTGIAAVNAAKPDHQVHAATQDKVAVNDRVTIKYKDGSVTMWNTYHINRVASGSYATYNSTYVVREVAKDENGNTFYRIGQDKWIEGRFAVKNNSVTASSLAAKAVTTNVAPQRSAASTSAVAKTATTNAAPQRSTASTNVHTSNGASQAADTARAQVGTPYVWGGNTPGGFDCSGLVQYSYGLGSNYRTTYQQTNLGAHQYDIQNAQKGDLYFWGTESAPYHVAVAQGNGNYVQAPAPGQNVKQGNIQYYTPNYYISMQNR